MALGLLAGGTPEREIYVSVTIEGDPAPPDTVLIGTYDIIPSNVTPGQRSVPAYGLSLVRLSENCQAPLYLAGLGFRTASLEGNAIDPSEVIDHLELEFSGRAASPASDPGPSGERQDAAAARGDDDAASPLEVALPVPMLIPPGDSLGIEVLADIEPLTRRPGFAFTLADGGVSVGQAGCPGPVLLVRHGDSPGPAVSTTTIILQDLAGSFTNYPNPFAAGREITTFTFYLQRRAYVSLRLYTGFGRLVRVLDPGTSRAPGLVHEDITWDGTDNGGVGVQNGTYFAVLSVRYDNGRKDEAVRKVAVLR